MASGVVIVAFTIVSTSSYFVVDVDSVALADAVEFKFSSEVPISVELEAFSAVVVELVI